MKLSNTLFAASIALGVVACSNIFQGEDTPVPYNSEDPMKSGEISLPVKPDPTFSWAPQPGAVNLGGLKSKAGGEPVLVVLGQGVAAGYRDGGLFREGQITSYPNLVARQMGLTNFKQPLFERENGNGTGRLVIDKAGGNLRWNEVTNNLAYENKGNSIEFKAFQGEQLNNFSSPSFDSDFLNGSIVREALAGAIAYNQNSSSEERMNINYLWDKYSMPVTLASRFLADSPYSGWEQINKMNPDLGIIDLGLDIYVTTHIRGGGRSLSTTQRIPAWELKVLDKAKDIGMKYVYTTIPDILDFPYFKLYSSESLLKKTGVTPKVLKYGIEPVNVSLEDILLPTTNVVNYYNGKFQGILSDTDVIRQEEAGRPELYNDKLVKSFAQQYGHPLVDFYSVYKKILSGNYVSEDGFKVDPSFPNGNFFSSDGIYPSAIGQAVLANEVIKVFNTSYGMQIPLIKIGDYAAEIAKNTTKIL